MAEMVAKIEAVWAQRLRKCEERVAGFLCRPSQRGFVRLMAAIGGSARTCVAAKDERVENYRGSYMLG